MKVYIYCDEAYPIYGIETDLTCYGKSVEIPDELYQRYLEAEKTYDEVQEELARYANKIGYEDSTLYKGVDYVNSIL